MDGATDRIFLVAPYVEGDRYCTPIGFYHTEEEATEAVRLLRMCRGNVSLEVLPVLKLGPAIGHYKAKAEPKTGITVEFGVSTEERADISNPRFTREGKGFCAVAFGTTELEAVSRVVSLVQEKDPHAQINMRITRR